MEPITAGLMGLGLMVLLILLHVPVAASMGLAGAVGFAMIAGVEPALSLFGVEAVSALTNLELAVVPLFLLTGSFATISGLSSDIYKLAYALIGHRPGGLASATILGCAGIGAICGSSLATAATMSRVAMPEMVARGYDPRLATGSIAAGGTLGILIPPSIIMVLYGVLTEQFVLTLFLAAVIPGIIAVGLHLITIAILVKRNPALGPAAEKLSWPDRFVAIRQSLPAMGIIGAIFIGLYGGIFTVNEAAAVGASLTILMAACRRKLSWASLRRCISETAATSGMIYMILIGASILTYLFSASGLSEAVVAWIQEREIPGLAVILLFILMYILLGCFFDTVASIIVTIPFVFPTILGLGYDPIWWGIVMVMVVETGLITPPFGMNVFVVYGTLKKVPLNTIYRGVTPFLIADLVRIAIIVLFPATALWLPSLMH